METELAELVAQYDVISRNIALFRLSLRTLDRAPTEPTAGAAHHHPDSRRKTLRGDAARQVRRLRRELELLLASRREVHAAMVACAATIPAFVQLQRTSGIGPVRAAHLLISCIAPASSDAAGYPSRRRDLRIDAFDEKR